MGAHGGGVLAEGGRELEGPIDTVARDHRGGVAILRRAQLGPRPIEERAELLWSRRHRPQHSAGLPEPRGDAGGVGVEAGAGDGLTIRLTSSQGGRRPLRRNVAATYAYVVAYAD
jgi:hypothetical protein